MQTTQLVAGNTLARTWILLQTIMAPLDLTGCTARFAIKSVLGGADVLNVATTDSSPDLTIPIAANGAVVLVVPAATTASIPPGLYVCALTMTYANGWVRTYDIENILVISTI